MRSSPSSASTSRASGDEALLHRLEQHEEVGDVLQEPGTEHAVGHLVEGLGGHREQSRAVRHREPAQQPAAEELDHPRRRVEHGQRVARRRRVDDDQVVVTRRVDVVELLHGEVVVAVHEAAGDVLVERVGQHGVAHLDVRRVAADEIVPAGLGVEHRRPQLAARGDAGRLERGVGDLRGDVAEGADAEGIGQPPGRVDGDDEHAPALIHGGGHADRRGERRLADAARTEHEHHLLARQQRVETDRCPSPRHQETSISSANALATRATTRRPVALVNSSGT